MATQGRCRSCAQALVLLLVSVATVSWGATPALLPATDTIWPGYNSGGVYVPEGVDTFRFVVTRQTCGYDVRHDHSCFALAAKCVFLMGTSPSNLQTAAQATGHPELPNLPVMSDGECNVIGLDWLNSNVSGRVICHYSNFAISDRSIFPDWVGIYQNQDASGAPMHYYSGSGSVPEIYIPNWGWPHGYYGANTKVWPLYHKMAGLCVPADWNPRAGRPALRKPMDACASTEYRGDPSTWDGVWPKIYPKNQYPGGNPGKGVWLPDEEWAFLWRAAVSRHPTQTQLDQGEANFGQTMPNSNLAGQPNIMIVSPSRPYQPHKNLGKNYPLYAINSEINIQVKNGFHTNVPPYDFTKLEIYDGNRKMGEIDKMNTYGVYIFSNCKLTKPGMRALIAIATLKDGTMATSRPAMIYVTDMYEATTVGIVPKGAKLQRSRLPGTPKLAVTLTNATSSRRGSLPAYDIRGALVRGGSAGIVVKPPVGWAAANR